MYYFENLSLEDLIVIIEGVEIKEQWKPIPFNPNRYLISSFGRVKSLEWSKNIPHLRNNPNVTMKAYIMRQGTNRMGYKTVGFCNNGVKKMFMVHRLVSSAFIVNEYNKPFVNHKDCDPKNNKLENLEWCTQSENIQYAYDCGSKKPSLHPNKGKTGIKSIYSIPVIQYDLDGKLIKNWDSISDIVRSEGYASTNISKACKGKLYSAYGFRWEYQNIAKTFFVNKIGQWKRIPILQYSLDGKFIKKFSYSYEAAKEVNGQSSGILKCCKGEYKTAYGFKWFFESK